MIDTYYKLSFILIMAMSAMAIIGLAPLLFIQSFIYKRIFDSTYFNNNHFSLEELAMYGSFPLYFIKTLAYVRAMVFPNTMKKRFKTRILNPKEKPIIYLLSLVTILIIIFGSIAIKNMGIVGIFIYFET